MNNLKKKIVVILISILSIFSISLFFIYNIGIYNRESNNVKEKLIRITTNHERFNNNHENPIFIDEDIYVVKFNVFRQIDKIVSYSPDGLNNKEIINLINNNINQINKEKINSLYTSNYIFFLNKDNTLIIMNNLTTKNYLNKSLISSSILFVLLELIILYGSYLITKWLVKPVEESFLRQKQFISDASHELKTPISIISASAETIEGKVKDKKWINSIKEETERMNYLVTNLLNLSKTEALKESEAYTLIDLSKLIKNKTLSFESLIFENNLQLKTKIEKNIMFNCNEDRMKELLSILLDNAIKHGEKNSTIEVELLKNKHDIKLLVTNKGDEIPESEREKIFERFYRVDESRNRSDNRYGLGLSIAKNIVLNHNGEIKVECENGYTTFKIVLKQN